MTLATIRPVTSTVADGDETPLTLAVYLVLRSGVTVNENVPPRAVVVLATAVTALKGYGLAYSSTEAPAGSEDGAVPDSVDGRPLETVDGLAVKPVVDVPGVGWEAASERAGTASNPATTIAAIPFASIPELYGHRAIDEVLYPFRTRGSCVSLQGEL